MCFAMFLSDRIGKPPPELRRLNTVDAEKKGKPKTIKTNLFKRKAMLLQVALSSSDDDFKSALRLIVSSVKWSLIL